jgi:HEAT repeat protein
MQQYITALNDKASPERWQSVIALEQLGKPAVDYLVHALKDEDKWVRYAAADALGNIGDQHIVDTLIGLLRDQDQDVRFVTADALGRLGDPKATGALHDACIHDNGFVKIAALEALAKIAP